MVCRYARFLLHQVIKNTNTILTMKKTKIFLALCGLALIAPFASASNPQMMWIVDDDVLVGYDVNDVDHLSFESESNWFTVKSSVGFSATDKLTKKVSVCVTKGIDDTWTESNIEIGICYSNLYEVPTLEHCNKAILATVTADELGKTYSTTFKTSEDDEDGATYTRGYARIGDQVWYSDATSSYVEAKSGAIVINKERLIDLGLPKGTLWAECNLGATKEYELGDTYAWAETEPKAEPGEDVKWDTYKWGKDDNLTKYNSSDNLTTIASEDDAATQTFGTYFHIPTEAEFEELLDNCTVSEATRTTAAGETVYGYEYKSKTKDASIFIPAVKQYSIMYWTSSLYSSKTLACMLGVFGHDMPTISKYYRYHCYYLRPVCNY